ncbi:hypothetical protein HDU82_008147 [Entophlyctis luteolus]|nr:hypothetical protein HDU82_008147 [Entophlyctis luteolus]
MTAQFCDSSTVFSLSVTNPPIALSSPPSALASLVHLGALGLHNALYGTGVLDSLFSTLQTPKYFQVLNMTGNPKYVSNATRVLTGAIPSLPVSFASSTGYFASLSLGFNNLTGSLPANVGDTLAVIVVKNNTQLTGALPSSAVQNTSGTAEWTLTGECLLTGTALCVPQAWGYQPACVRSIADSLPTCEGGAVLAIDPNGVRATSTSSSTSGFLASYLPQFIGLLVIFVVVVVVGVYYARRRRRMAAGGSSDQESYYVRRPGDYEMEMRRAEEMNLPAYMPQVPEYVVAPSDLQKSEPGETNGTTVMQERK